MRLKVVITLISFATLAAVSIAFAEDKKAIANNKVVKYDTEREVTTTGPVDAPYGGITRKEHDAIEYQPCLQALGWDNGKLRCNND
jgi:hypothetical protein